jgi:rhodanese-related sulfurtransferase
MKHGYLAMIAAALLLVAACTVRSLTPGTTEASKVSRLTPQELHQWLDAKDFVLINVHVPFEAGIPGTDVYIPYDEIEEHASLMPTDKQAKIVLYCKSGGMASAAADTLLRMGYTNLYDLEGGFDGWGAAGYELLKQEP